MNKDAKVNGWREALAEKVCSRTDFAPNAQYVHTPWDLGGEMLGKLKEYTSLADKRILAINLEVVELLCYDFGVKKENVWFITDCKEKANVAKVPRYAGVNVVLGDYLDWSTNMKFDVIVGNPPYNPEKGESAAIGGKSLWPYFVVKSIELLKDGGYLCFVHPCGWRSPKGMFTNTKALLTSKQIKYLEIHNAKQGMDTFGVSTRYDWYVLQNLPANGKTIVVGEDGKKYEANLEKLSFIPNGMFEEIMSLVAKDGEEKTTTISDSSYHASRTEITSRTKIGEFKHPIIHSIRKGGLNLIQSNTKDRGHFGIPKVIFGHGQSDTYVDTTGQYGMSQHTHAIVGTPEELDKINTAINSPEFLEVSKYCCLISTGKFIDKYNKDVIALFRKDFWKAFV